MNEAMNEENSKRLLPKLVLLAAVICLVLWLGYKWWWGMSHVTSDNAQVESHIIPVLPKVGGFVAAVKVGDNQPVHAGDLLATIDDRDYRARLAQAEAELALALAGAGSQGQLSGQATAQVAAMRASAAAARSMVEQALANADRAQKDLDRTRALVAQKMVSAQALDAAQAAARAALAQVQASRASAASAGEQVTASSAALRAALAKVDAARAARDLAANQLADTRIVAPVSGVVASKSVEPGQLVQAGQPLLSVVPLNDIWVVANLKETDLAGVKPGDPVAITVDAYPGLKVAGAVDSLSPATGARFSLLPPDNATGNFTKVVQRVPVKIRLQQNPDLARQLRPGMSVVVSISTQ
ncbi:multidrug export protein EmrA [mine drainage metagenome]|uniref:Multidrug export protein EmrA n=1 Tax=mine drainage metagenome TaxID=410659 RepID=A0A1J5R3I2_9ZZZZ